MRAIASLDDLADLLLVAERAARGARPPCRTCSTFPSIILSITFSGLPGLAPAPGIRAPLELVGRGHRRGGVEAGWKAAICIASPHEALEVLGPGDEVGLAVHFDEDADLAAG